jgi:hypothetical protein
MSDVLTTATYAVCEGRVTALEALDWLPVELQPRFIDFLLKGREEVLFLATRCYECLSPRVCVLARISSWLNG